MKHLANGGAPHRKFLIGIADGLSVEQAGKLSGLTNPHRDLRPLLYDEAAKAFIAQRIRDKITTEIAPMALKVAVDMLLDPKTPQRVRWDISKTFMAAGAGVVAPKAEELEPPPKDISQMTAGEIMAMRRSLESEMVNRSSGAKLIEGKTQPTPEDIDSLM